MESLLRDLRFSFRRLRKNPVFTLIAIVSLALGIGANTAIFTLVNAILLRRAPITHPEQVVEINTHNDDFAFGPFSYPDFRDYREATRDVFASLPLSWIGLVTRDVGDRVQQLPIESVNGDYFPGLGLKPFMGRLIGPEDDVARGAHAVAVLSCDYWKKATGADPAIVGKTMRLTGREYTVIGVAPRDYEGNIRGVSPSMYLPIMMINDVLQGTEDELQSRGDHSIMLKGRLRPGVSIAQARAVSTSFAAGMVRKYPMEWTGKQTILLTPLNDVLMSPMLDKQLSAAAALLMSIVALVLLVACANLASFLLAQARDRQREIAIRLAIGASRSALIRQLLTETIILALLGGAVGVLLARVLLNMLLHIDIPLVIPVTLNLAPDLRVLGFALAASVVAGVLFGLAPALQSTRPDVIETIKNENTGGSPRKFTMRDALVVGQVAVSLVLLLTAGLFMRSLQARQNIDPGFGHANAGIITIGINGRKYTEESGRQLTRTLEQRALAIPGVESVGVISNLHLNPLSTQNGLVNVAGFDPPKGEPGFVVDRAHVDAGYFAAVGTQIVKGRNFDDLRDNAKAPKVVIINEVMAKRFWPNSDPIGQMMKFDTAQMQVIGVARNAKIRFLGEDPRLFAYVPYSQNYTTFMSMVARTRGDADRTALQLLAAAHGLDADLMIFETKTMARHLAVSMLPSRLAAIAIAAFASLALALALLGVYGVVSYAVARRSREVGIRLSLGARPQDMVRMLMKRGLALVAIGGTIGLVLALLITSALQSMLYGVKAIDPLTFTTAPMIVLIVGVAASLIPALRASRVDPARVLKTD